MKLNDTSVRGLEFRGQPRAQINGKGPDYLEPKWVEDPVTRGPIRAGDGHLMIHYLRMHDSKEGRGPLLSAVNAEGAEIWRYVLPFPNLHSVVVHGDQLVLGLNEKTEYGPGWLWVLDLKTGQEVWKMSL